MDLSMDEFSVYLERHRLARPQHIPFIRRWVERFLSGTHHPSLAWEDRVREYGAALQQHPGLADWQVQQAEESALFPEYRELIPGMDGTFCEVLRDASSIGAG